MKKYEDAIRAARDHGLQPSDVKLLLDWWEPRKQGFESPQGALYHALTKTHPQSLEKIPECFPPVDPAVAASLAASVRQARELEQQKTLIAGLEQKKAACQAAHQLELDFERQYGPILDELTDEKLKEVCDGAKLPKMVWQLASQRNGRKKPTIRFELLQAIQKMNIG